MEKEILTEIDINNLVDILVSKLPKNKYSYIYPIPTGAYPVAVRLSERLKLPLISSFIDIIDTDQVLIVDDVIDSGETLMSLFKTYPMIEKCDVAALFQKESARVKTIYFSKTLINWVVFPWDNDQADIKNNVTRVLQYIGEDVQRDGLLDTPTRVVKSWDKLFGGYKQDPKKLMKEFDNPGYDEMVLLKDIEFYSTCEHHIQPFFGKAHIAYVPGNKVVGISKLSRLLEVYTRRLQIQERIGEQVTDFLMKEMGALGAACILEAQHFCMVARGVEKHGAVMSTSSIKGCFRNDAKARSELMSLVK